MKNAAYNRRLLTFLGLSGVTFLVSMVANGGVNRWTTSGPFGGTITSLAIDPTNPDTVYAGTSGQVFKSRDGGLNWTASFSVPGMTLSGRSGLAIDPVDSSNVYDATGTGVFKSSDAGGNWTAVGPGAQNQYAFSVAIDPLAHSTVYTGTAGGLFKSDDGGTSWSGPLLASWIYNLVFSAQTPATVFAADFDDSFYSAFYPSYLSRSTDQGATWSHADTGIWIVPGSLAIDPTNPSNLYAGNYRGDGVYKSENSGSTWTPISSSLGFGSVSAVAIDSRNPRTLYAATHGAGVVRSADGGATWTEFNTGLPIRDVTALAIDRTGTRLHAGTRGLGVFDHQIVSGPAPLDISVGTDNKAHVLFTDSRGRVVFQEFDNSGKSTSVGPYGPFDGWSATAMADGPDDLTRVLWNLPDGSAALWMLGPTGKPASYRYGPAAGWMAVDVSVGSDGTTHLLWTNIDGRAHLTSLASSGAVIGGTTYGPYGSWLARSISDGADGLTRLLWSNIDGRTGLSLIDEGRIIATSRFAPPGWTAHDVTVGSDNRARILFVDAEGRVALWSVDNSGAVTNSAPIYEAPSSDQAAARISAGADGVTRVLWTSPAGTGTLWLMGLDNTRLSSFGFGPDPCAGCWDY